MLVLPSINMSILKSCCYYTSKYFSIKRLQDISASICLEELSFITAESKNLRPVSSKGIYISV